MFEVFDQLKFMYTMKESTSLSFKIGCAHQVYFSVCVLQPSKASMYMPITLSNIAAVEQEQIMCPSYLPLQAYIKLSLSFIVCSMVMGPKLDPTKAFL